MKHSDFKTTLEWNSSIFYRETSQPLKISKLIFYAKFYQIIITSKRPQRDKFNKCDTIYIQSKASTLISPPSDGFDIELQAMRSQQIRWYSFLYWGCGWIMLILQIETGLSLSFEGKKYNFIHILKTPLTQTWQNNNNKLVLLLL